MKNTLHHPRNCGRYSQEQPTGYTKHGEVLHITSARKRNVRRKMRRKIITSIIQAVVIGVMLAVDIWVLASCLDIAFHNNDFSPVYQAWNLFNFVF